MRRSCSPLALPVTVLFAGAAFARALVASPSRAQSAPDPDQDAEAAPAGDEYVDTDPSALSDFAPALDPYGSWVVDPTYGTVWTPSTDQVGTTFQPYETAGSWSYADGDYSWVSDYAWGWVCFHYGRWVLSAGHWVWIPGRRYAGAWVSWRVSDDADGYIGWAPIAPTWFWLGGSAVSLGFAAAEPWAFSTFGDFAQPNVGAHLVPGSAAAAVAARTRLYAPPPPTGTTRPGAPHAPPPAMLGIDASRITPLAVSAQESRARQFARPSTAVALGARPPSRRVPRPMARPEVAPRGTVGETRGPAHGHR